MPGKKMPPKKGLMIMIGMGKPRGKPMGKPMAKGKMAGKEDYEESPAMERKEYGLLNKAVKAPAMKKAMPKKPAAKMPGGIKTMAKGKKGSGSQGRGY